MQKEKEMPDQNKSEKQVLTALKTHTAIYNPIIGSMEEIEKLMRSKGRICHHWNNRADGLCEVVWSRIDESPISAQPYVGVKRVQAWAEEKNGQPGYHVVYDDNYHSWSPKDVFEKSYISVGDKFSYLPGYMVSSIMCWAENGFQKALSWMKSEGIIPESVIELTEDKKQAAEDEYRQQIENRIMDFVNQIQADEYSHEITHEKDDGKSMKVRVEMTDGSILSIRTDWSVPLG